MTPFILFLYLLLLILIAIGSSKKIENYSDFFIARKKGSLFAVTGSLTASILGGSAIIGAVDAGTSMGRATTWFMLCASLGLIALIPLSGRINKLGRFTLPELLEDLYGEQAKFIASIIIPVAWIGIIAAQIMAAAKILQSFTGMSYTAGAVISGMVFIGYTLAGGQVSILKTDSVQALLIIAGLFLVALFAYNYPEQPPVQLVSSTFPFNPHFTPFDLLILIFTYSTTFTAGPDIYSRLFCARDGRTAKKSIILTAIILIPVAIIIGFLSTFSLEPGGVHSGAKLIEISVTVLPKWLIPIIVISLLSAVLSSADTTILSSSIIVTELFEKNKFGKNSIRKTRYIILLTGIISIIIALNFTSIIGMLLIALTVYSGAFTLPIIFGLMGVKSKPLYVSCAIITGGIIALTGKMISVYASKFYGNLIILASFLINVIFLFSGRIKESPSNRQL